MNNFVFSQDPLLYTALSNKQNPQMEYDMKKQLVIILAPIIKHKKLLANLFILIPHI